MSRKRRILGFVVVLSLVFLVTGCESLRRKFVRTKKGSDVKESMVIVPRDYSAHPFPNDVLYRQSFMYWKSWNQELVRGFEERSSYKKILDCLEQCLLNLKKMKSYLAEEQSAKLDVYVEKTQRLKQQVGIQPNLLPSQYDSFRYDAERILSIVNRQFDAHKMKDAIKTNESGV